MDRFTNDHGVGIEISGLPVIEVNAPYTPFEMEEKIIHIFFLQVIR